MSSPASRLVVVVFVLGLAAPGARAGASNGSIAAACGVIEDCQLAQREPCIDAYEELFTAANRPDCTFLGDIV